MNKKLQKKVNKALKNRKYYCPKDIGCEATFKQIYDKLQAINKDNE